METDYLKAIKKFCDKHNSQFNINFKNYFHKMSWNKSIGDPKLNVIILMLYKYLILETFDS